MMTPSSGTRTELSCLLAWLAPQLAAPGKTWQLQAQPRSALAQSNPRTEAIADDHTHYTCVILGLVHVNIDRQCAAARM